MSKPRFFIIGGDSDVDAFHDRVERHGIIIHSRLFDAEVCPNMVYGIAEIVPHAPDEGESQ